MGDTGPAEALIVLVAIVLVLWLLAVLVRRQVRRECPACGKWVKRGNLKCKGCGYAFRRAVR